MSAASAPVTLLPISPTIKHVAHNLMRRSPPRIPCASSEKSPHGTTSFSSASSPNEKLTQIPLAGARFKAVDHSERTGFPPPRSERDDICGGRRAVPLPLHVMGMDPMSGGGNIVQFDNVGLRYGTDRRCCSDIWFPPCSGRLSTSSPGARRGQDLAAQAALPRPAPDPRADPHVRRGAIRLPRERLPAFRRRIGTVFQDFRLVRAPVGIRQRRAAVARRAAPRRAKSRSRCARCSTGSGSPTAPTRARHPVGRRAAARGDRPRGDRPPEMLVADEPTGNVDSEMARRCCTCSGAQPARHHGRGRDPRRPPDQRHAGLRRSSGSTRGGWAIPPARCAIRRARRIDLAATDRRSWLANAAAERRLLPSGGCRRPMPWVIAIMMFADGDRRHRRPGAGNSRRTGSTRISRPDRDPDGRRRPGGSDIAAADHRRRGPPLPGVAQFGRMPEAAMRGTPALARAGRADKGDLPVPAMIHSTCAPEVMPRLATASHEASAPVREVTARARGSPACAMAGAARRPDGLQAVAGRHGGPAARRRRPRRGPRRTRRARHPPATIEVMHVPATPFYEE